MKLVLQIPFILVFRSYGPLLSTTIALMVPIVLMYRKIQTITQFNRTIIFKRTLLGSILTVVMLLGVLIAGLILGWIFPPNGRVSSMIYIIVIGGLGVAIYGALGLWLRYFDRFIGGQAARLDKNFGLNKPESWVQKCPASPIIFGLSSKTQWLSGSLLRWISSAFTALLNCVRSGTTKSNSNELTMFLSHSLSLYSLKL
ncbi:MAG: polysaccharide biosynthesis C-terminal domain-containing protein [Streptococcus sp.]